MMKNISLALGLVTVLALQGCGGGGSGDTSETTKSGSTSGYTSSSTKKSATKKAPTKMDSLSTEDVDKAKDSSLENGTANEQSCGDYGCGDKNFYFVKERLLKFDEHNETTTYTYDGNFTATYEMNSTNGETIEKRYDFNATSGVLNVYVKNIIGTEELTQRAKFANTSMSGYKNFMNGDNVYFTNTFDPIFFAGYRIVENVTNIEKGLFNTKKYEYITNNCSGNGCLNKITVGYYNSLTDDNMTVEKVINYEKNSSIRPKNVVYGDDNMSISAGNAVYKFVKFEQE